MFVDDSTSSQNGRSYRRVLLRESFWEEGKVKHRTIANLSRCSEEEISAMKLALKHKGNLGEIGRLSTDLTLRQGPSVGAVFLLWAIARRIGIIDALGSSRQGKLALWQVIARLLNQGSRLSAVRLAETRPVCEILDLNEAFDEEDLYENLAWLDREQRGIEKRLLKARRGDRKPELFLYDVTSSYLEGEHNELAAFGYNRDRKRGKMQLVIGLLCDEEGWPVSAQVFEGNTQDPKTLASQIRKVADDFDCKAVTFVGDRGMIKSAEIQDLRDEDFFYITALTRPQIASRLKSGVFQKSLFDSKLAEVVADDIRYVLRRNPVRTEEIALVRRQKKDAIQHALATQNVYLEDHPRATVVVAERRMGDRIKKLGVDKWLSATCEGRSFHLEVDEEALAAESALDGCYCVRSNLPATAASAATIHARYKDLALVETAFRTCKTGLLEMRPVLVRTQQSTRGHVLVVMLAYLIAKYLREAWKNLGHTVEEGLQELDAFCAQEVVIDGGSGCCSIPVPRDLSQKLLDAAEVRLLQALPKRGIPIATKKKLASRRKQA
ncbi:MAG: IS1634 family transposase [Candidatus Schekmanbacteria bacterium]|nr:IS1634 family transposase [Candidatus Schekmanbacteria bacterium]